MKNHFLMLSLKRRNLAQAKYTKKIHSASLAWVRCRSPYRALCKKNGCSRIDFCSSEKRISPKQRYSCSSQNNTRNKGLFGPFSLKRENFHSRWNILAQAKKYIFFLFFYSFLYYFFLFYVINVLWFEIILYLFISVEWQMLLNFGAISDKIV